MLVVLVVLVVLEGSVVLVVLALGGQNTAASLELKRSTVLPL